MARSSSALARRHVEGIGEGSLVGTFSRLLQLTSDCVLVFDGGGKVLLANEEAAELLGAGDVDVAGLQIQELFPDLGDADAADDGSPVAGLPFSLDGSSSPARCRGLDGELRPVSVRCESVQAPGETYLLVAHPTGDGLAEAREHDRTVDDLKRVNKRLSGAFNIVLDTLDAPDVAELFTRVLDRLYQTLDADGTIVYLAGADGFHLRGLAGDIDGGRVPRFMHFGRTVETLATRAGKAIRLRVAAPSGEALRAGRLASREVVNEDTREVIKIQSKLLPPFTSFVAVPVWFD
ncbi:PAS domain-containing protein, partial [Paratractidigestivibacter sp.]|uniref:PAS domain-containing protein n=1 Tax=Paratractidigestivibacter sp. TaxID=2847316 RepID=UPI0040294954